MVTMKLFRIKIGADAKFTLSKRADWSFVVAENKDSAISILLDYRHYYDFVDKNEDLDIEILEYLLDNPRVLPHSRQTDTSEILECLK